MNGEIVRGILAIDVDVVSDDRGWASCETTKHSVTFSVNARLNDRSRAAGTKHELGQQLARLVAPVLGEFTGTNDDLIDGVIDWFTDNQGDA